MKTADADDLAHEYFSKYVALAVFVPSTHCIKQEEGIARRYRSMTGGPRRLYLSQHRPMD
jgi:hypothetical protein